MRVLPLLLLAACGGGALLEDGFEAALDQRGGCADLILYAHDPADTVELLARSTDGLVAQARTSGAAVQVTYDLPDPGFTLQVEVGRHVGYQTCNDVVIEDEVVERTYVAISGEVVLNAVPVGDGDAVNGAMTVREAVLEDEDGNRVELVDYGLSASVGWLPG